MHVFEVNKASLFAFIYEITVCYESIVSNRSCDEVSNNGGNGQT